MTPEQFLYFFPVLLIRAPGRGLLSRSPLAEGGSRCVEQKKKKADSRRMSSSVTPANLLPSDRRLGAEGAPYSLYLFLFHSAPFSAVSPVVSPNSSSCTIPTTGEVAIQTTSDGAEERAIVSEGLTLLLSIDWKGEKGS